jgi:cytochrome c biogenesis protein ResB
VGKVPFLPIVLFGFVLLFMGMYMAFFMNHRRYWARLMKLPDDEWELALVGIAKRHPYQFEDEFKKYAQNGQNYLREISKNEEQNA